MDRTFVGRPYTATGFQSVPTKGQVVGWVQGGLAILGGLLHLRFVGPMPTLLVIGVVAFLPITFLAGRKYGLVAT
jgi:hypothetical protein